MTTTKLRTLLLSLVLAVSTVTSAPPSPASADVVATPPPRLVVEAETQTYTTPPRSVVLSIRNPSAETVELQGLRLVVLTTGVRIPLRITRVELDGRPAGAWDRITLQPSATARLRLDFEDVPETSLRARQIDFALRIGHAAEATFSLRRAPR